MATNKRLLNLPAITIPTTGTMFYLVENGQSYQGSVDQVANLLISNYGLSASGVNISISGVTVNPVNVVYTTGNQTIGGNKTFSDNIGFNQRVFEGNL